MLDFGILRLVSLLIECSCIAPHTLAMIVMRGLVSILHFVDFGLMGRIWYVYVLELGMGIYRDNM